VASDIPKLVGGILLTDCFFPVRNIYIYEQKEARLYRCLENSDWKILTLENGGKYLFLGTEGWS